MDTRQTDRIGVFRACGHWPHFEPLITDGPNAHLAVCSRVVEAIVDTSQRPLCRITVGAQPSVESIDGILVTVANELSRHRAICVLANAQHTTHLEFAHVKKIVAFGEQYHMMIEAYLRALAFVIPSPMVRGLIRLAFQIKPPPHPVKIFSTEPEAQAYLTPFLVDI